MGGIARKQTSLYSYDTTSQSRKKKYKWHAWTSETCLEDSTCLSLFTQRDLAKNERILKAEL